MAIRVYLANEHDIVREGLKNILSRNPIFNICGEFNSNLDIISHIEKTRPSLLFFDISSHDNYIIKNLPKIRIVCPKILVIAIIYSNDRNLYQEMLSKEGISAFFHINFKIEELMKGMSSILSNKIFVQESIMKEMKNTDIDRNSDLYKINSLTKREMEVLVQVANGMFNKEIAISLNISERTVKNHLSNIFKKLEVSDRTQAAVIAIKNNIVEI